mmetsp:Transcript_105237/g.181880  ORF Transcript_105237/g.181880 Transcript_105237/m.181880 type:complete len:307 (-) Transcript_105237:126-1046(-)
MQSTSSLQKVNNDEGCATLRQQLMHMTTSLKGKNDGVDVFCEQVFVTAAQLASTKGLDAHTEWHNLNNPKAGVDVLCEQLLNMAAQLGSMPGLDGNAAPAAAMAESQSLGDTMRRAGTDSVALCERIFVRMAAMFGNSTAKSTLELGSTMASTTGVRTWGRSLTSTLGPLDSLQFSSEVTPRPCTAGADNKQFDTAECLDLTLHPNSLSMTAVSMPSLLGNNANTDESLQQLCNALLSTDLGELQRLDEAMEVCQKGLDANEDRLHPLLDQTITPEGGLLGGLPTLLLNLSEGASLNATLPQGLAA